MDSIICKGKSMDRPLVVNKEIEHEFQGWCYNETNECI